MNLGFDIDGVIAKSDIFLLRLIDLITIDSSKRIDLEKWYYRTRGLDLNPSLFKNSTDDKIILITGRSMYTKELTISWLGQRNIKYDKLIFADIHPPAKVLTSKLEDWYQYQASKKAEILKDEKIEVYFEDTPSVIKYLRELCPEIKIICYGDYPENV